MRGERAISIDRAMRIFEVCGACPHAALVLTLAGEEVLACEWMHRETGAFLDEFITSLPGQLDRTLGRRVVELKPRWATGTSQLVATRFQFARFGGACPLWIVHEAAAIPDRILVQLAATPDGLRYVSIAKGLVKASGRFDRTPRRYAVALGCELAHAEELIYADGLDVSSLKAITPIGVSCRICPRTDCDQRAYPPSDRSISVDLFHRGVVPFKVASDGRTKPT